MMSMQQTIQLFCALSFLIYGLTCLRSGRMVYEFQRYGIPQYRHLTGILQLSAALGLLAGYIQPWMAQVAAGGLTADGLWSHCKVSHWRPLVSVRARRRIPAPLHVSGVVAGLGLLLQGALQFTALALYAARHPSAAGTRSFTEGLIWR